MQWPPDFAERAVEWGWLGGFQRFEHTGQLQGSHSAPYFPAAHLHITSTFKGALAVEAVEVDDGASFQGI